MPVLDYTAAYGYAKQAGATDDEAAFLASVAGPESGYNTEAHNPDASTGDNSYGLWQVNMLGQMGVNRAKQWGLQSYDQLFDPVTNATAALDILRSQGKKAWTTYTSGAYKSYQQGIPSAADIGAATTPTSAAPAAPAAPQRSLAQNLMDVNAAASGAPAPSSGDTLESRLSALNNIFGQAGFQLKGPPNG